MKLQITFDLTNLEKATTLLPALQPSVDAIEIGSLLIYKHGEQAIVAFRKAAPDKELIVDSKIVDHAKETTSLLINAGADWITVMAGTKKSVIHTACTTAYNMGKKVMVNMLDASSAGQAALEAKSLGADALIFHLDPSSEDAMQLLDTWQMVKGNTTLPIYIETPVSIENLDKIIALNPAGIIISLNDNNLGSAEELIAMVRSRIS